eukprot:scaffold374_cov271-Pinguiococcus_pyrenoidosus.AAC.12
MSFQGLLDQSRPLDQESPLVQVAQASFEAFFEGHGASPPATVSGVRRPARVFSLSMSREILQELQSSIPAILHVIWLGDAMPPHFTAIVSRWEQLHPAWELLRWTETEVVACSFTFTQGSQGLLTWRTTFLSARSVHSGLR